MRAFTVALIVTAACGQPTSADGRRSRPAACSAKALGLGTAKPLAAWRAPAGCTWQAAIGDRQISSEAELRTRLACKDPSLVLGLDFTRTSLVASTSPWSPAQTGVLAYDDGARVTLVRSQRAPCKDDPRPMPTPPITSAFTSTVGARTFATATCTLPSTCR